MGRLSTIKVQLELESHWQIITNQAIVTAIADVMRNMGSQFGLESWTTANLAIIQPFRLRKVRFLMRFKKKKKTER